MTTTLTIMGGGIHDIPSFYDELNRVFMADEDCKLAQSLDALDDLLRGGYGAVRGAEAIRLVWRDIAVARSGLGVAATRALLESKLERPDVYNVELIRRQLTALEAGSGQTYFDLVIEIIAGHPNIELVPA